jgi:hypothetical protein
MTIYDYFLIQAKRLNKGQNDIKIRPRDLGKVRNEVRAMGGEVSNLRDVGIGTAAALMITIMGLDEEDLDEIQRKWGTR